MKTAHTPPSSSIQFHDHHPEMVKKLQQEIDSLGPTGEIFRNFHFFDLNNLENQSLVEAYRKSLKEVAELLFTNPESRILLSAWYGIDQVRKEASPLFELALSHENVHFYRFADSMKDLGKSMETVKDTSHDENFFSRMLSLLQHDVHPDKTKTPKVYERGIRMSRLFVNKFFPSQVQLDDNKLVTFIQGLTFNILEVMKGEKIQGVYCDIEGTLLINGELNSACLRLLKQYESEGKVITLWTLGDTNKLSRQLENLSVHYPVKSKLDFAGAEGEIIIDDMNEEELERVTKITAQTFIPVSSIQSSLI